MKSIRCFMCGKPYIPTSGRQLFCGSVIKKIGCSYLAALARYKAWKKLHPQKTKEYNVRFKKLNPTYWKNYYLENRPKNPAQQSDTLE